MKTDGKFGIAHYIQHLDRNRISMQQCDWWDSTSWKISLASATTNYLDTSLSPNRRLFSPHSAPRFLVKSSKRKVNKYDSGWKKDWYGPGLFYEGSEELEVDVFKKIEKRKVLSNVEKAGLLSKAEEFGVTLSYIEKLGLLSKAEDLGLLSLLEKTADTSPSILASAALPLLVAAVAAIVVIPDDSVALVVTQVVIAVALAVGGVGLVVGSILVGELQEAD